MSRICTIAMLLFLVLPGSALYGQTIETHLDSNMILVGDQVHGIGVTDPTGRGAAALVGQA